MKTYQGGGQETYNNVKEDAKNCKSNSHQKTYKIIESFIKKNNTMWQNVLWFDNTIGTL